jgi:pimeloyl-ACP methyl ester carboxylesterase
MQSHYPIAKLAGDHADSLAILSTAPTGHACIFIHGYSGNPFKTWTEFERMVYNAPALAGHDFYFFGYDGIRSELVASAGVFRSFLKSLAGPPFELTFEPASPGRAQDFLYNSIVIVAHSLGAVLTRWALLDLRQESYSNLDRFRFLLFAPAHKGSRVAKLAAMAAGGFPLVGALVTALHFASPLVEQLAAGSQELQNLEARTQKAIAEDGPRSYLVAHKVWIATREQVVVNMPFASDPLPEPFLDCNHMTLCKPSESFPRPFLEVLNALQ